MRQFFVGAAICLATSVLVCYATMGGQYSVNIHFVPPLVSGACQVAQFWNPPNVTCALCFCMTGAISRCVPQPGCVPSNVTVNGTTTTPNPNNPSSSPSGVQVPTQDTVTVTPTSQPTSTTVNPNPATQGEQGQGSDPNNPPPPPPPPSPEGSNLIRKRRSIIRKRQSQF